MSLRVQMLSEYLLLRSKSDVNYNPLIAGFIFILIGFK